MGTLWALPAISYLCLASPAVAQEKDAAILGVAYTGEGAAVAIGPRRDASYAQESAVRLDVDLGQADLVSDAAITVALTDRRGEDLTDYEAIGIIAPPVLPGRPADRGGLLVTRQSYGSPQLREWEAPADPREGMRS